MKSVVQWVAVLGLLFLLLGKAASAQQGMPATPPQGPILFQGDTMPGGWGPPPGQPLLGDNRPFPGQPPPPGQFSPPGGGPMPPPPQISREDEEEFLQFVKQEDPERLEDLKEAKEREPFMYQRMIGEGIQHMRFLNRLKKDNPELYAKVRKEQQAEREVQKLVKSYRQTKDTKQREQLKRELRQRLETLFDLRQSHREEEIKRIEKELATLREKTAERKKNRERIIESKLNEVAGELTEW